MKKTLKNIIICICIIYFILSLSSLLITKELIHEQWMTIVDVLKDNETEPVKSLYIELNKIIDTNLIIVGISALIGTIIGLVISKRESSVTRYIVYFIVGFVLYSFLWIGINYLINLSVGNGKYVEFIELYKEVLKPVIISYIMLYIVSIVVIINLAIALFLDFTIKSNFISLVIFPIKNTSFIFASLFKIINKSIE